MAVTVLHASDLHFGRPHLHGASERLRELVTTEAPDLLVFSGDFTQRAKVREYREAAAFLESLPPIPRVVTSGNHDVALYRFWERLIFPFRNYRRWIHPHLDYEMELPGISVVSLSSAAPRRAIVNGRLSRAQLDFAQEVLLRAPSHHLRMAVIHHPLVSPEDGVKAAPIPGAMGILERLYGMGVDLVLGGHFHRAFAREWSPPPPVEGDAREGMDHPMCLVMAGTATSARGRGVERDRNSVNLIRVDSRSVTVTPMAREAPGDEPFRPDPVRTFRRRMRTGLGRALGLLGASLLALAVGGSALTAQAGLQTQLRPEVTEVDFQGNFSVTSRSLSAAIVTRPTECRSFVLKPFCIWGADFALIPAFLRSRELADDLARVQIFYYQRGFREVQVDTVVTRDPEDGTAGVVFQIQEGRPILVDTLRLVGLDDLDDPSVAEGLPISLGDPLNLIALDAARDTLEVRLQNRGFAHAEVLRSLFIPQGSYGARVEYDIYPGPVARFGEIQISGNEAVATTAVRRMLPFREGDVYSRSEIFQAQRNLFNLEVFRYANVTQDLEHQPDSIVPMSVTVAEGQMRSVRAGGGWSSAECFNTEARWSGRNFMGGARQLQLRGRASNLLAPTLQESICRQSGVGAYSDLNWLLSAEFTQPWFFSSRNSVTASIYGERQSLPDVFIRRAVGLNLGITRNLGGGTGVTLSYRPQLAELDAAEIFFCISFLVCDPGDIDLLQGRNWLSPVGVTLTRDRTNRAISPTSGYTALLDLELAHGGTASDFGYQRVIGEGTLLREPSPGWIVAVRGRGGWLRSASFQGLFRQDEAVEVAHPQKRFYSGGASSVRGFSQSQLGPRVLTLPVESLVGGVGNGAVCPPRAIIDLTCDATVLSDDRFLPRPTGGSLLTEANVELRFPLWGPLVQGTAFMDTGQVWADGSSLEFSQLEFTPGVGVRYFTPIGPVRLDVAYRTGAAQSLQVVTSQLRPYDPDRDAPDDQVRGPDGATLPFVASPELALLDPQVVYGAAGPWSLRRLQLHFSIGQAF
ncbi:MAG: BamA/TamA family outer membrane protein [Gemmatimonadota bacterium]